MLNFSLNLYKAQVNSNNILSSINNRNNVVPSLLFIHLLIPSLVLWLVRLSGRGDTRGQCGLALALRRNAPASLCSAVRAMSVLLLQPGPRATSLPNSLRTDHEGMLDFTAALSVCPLRWSCSFVLSCSDVRYHSNHLLFRAIPYMPEIKYLLVMKHTFLVHVRFYLLVFCIHIHQGPWSAVSLCSGFVWFSMTETVLWTSAVFSSLA